MSDRSNFDLSYNGPSFSVTIYTSDTTNNLANKITLYLLFLYRCTSGYSYIVWTTQKPKWTRFTSQRKTCKIATFY